MIFFRALFFVSIAMASSSCSSANKTPVGNIELHDLQPARLTYVLGQLRRYAKDHDLVLTENRINKDGRQVSLLDLHHKKCLAISADNFKRVDSIELFFYECNGFDWKTARSYLDEALRQVGNE